MNLANEKLPMVVTIDLRERDGDWWGVDMTVDDPSKDAPIKPTAGAGESPGMQLDLDELAELALDSEAYGKMLTERLFRAPQIRDGFVKAREAADRTGRLLRLRLHIAASQLNAVHWEKLRDPEDDRTILALQERVILSRWPDSRDWRPVNIRPKTQLQAVIAVAGPKPETLGDNPATGVSFAEVRVDEEIERARSGLDYVANISTVGQNEPATLDNVIKAIKEAPDIVYLVCHGYVDRGSPRLVLEDEDRNMKPVRADEFIDQLSRVITLPRLMVLASCQSGGGHSMSQDDGALAALGPRLAEIGVPAVVAMQGDISLETIATFVPAMFESLQQDGYVDRAMAAARNQVRDRPDWWQPMLLSRLTSGRIWYAPSFGEAAEDPWEFLRSAIGHGKCTPIIGPGLTDRLVGTRKDMARTWAARYGFPIPSPSDEDLPQVAQYMEKRGFEGLLRTELRSFIGGAVIGRYKDELAGEFDGADFTDSNTLDELISSVGEIARESNKTEPHRVLARMNVPAYVTTHPTSLLTDALTAQTRDPVVDYFRWRDDGIEWPALGQEAPERLKGSKDHPMVYHLFGHLKFTNSVVLMEDDYFDFLRAIGGARGQAIPKQLTDGLVRTSLLFVGFRLDEWDFRVLFRGLMNLEGEKHREKWPHFAVQLDPEESATNDPDRARRYLEKYFGGDFTIYWGDSVRFLDELSSELEDVLLPEPVSV